MYDSDLRDELSEVDQKSFDCIHTLISGNPLIPHCLRHFEIDRVRLTGCSFVGGKLEKLKVDQCKVYLRKHGLRLTGNKDTLIERIKEHTRYASYPFIPSIVEFCFGTLTASRFFFFTFG